MDLKDKQALITGGTSGMRIATALAMAAKGATMIITGRGLREDEMILVTTPGNVGVVPLGTLATCLV